METLLLDDAAYVDERFRALAAERQRYNDLSAPPSTAIATVTAVWPPSLGEKQVAVMTDVLRHLAAQTHDALCADGAVSQPTKTAEIKTEAEAVAPSVDELSASSQLGFRLFFRLSASLRAMPHGAVHTRLVPMVAAKMPSLLAKLPPMPLAPGVTDVHGNTQSVLEDLLGIFRSILDQTDLDKTLLSEPDRGNVLMAYIAVSLKWGRLRDLVVVMQLLITLPNILTPSHIEQLASSLSELVQADAVVPTQQLLPEESTASGYLVSFGKGDHGKLGHGQCTHASCSDGNCTENKNVPTVIASTRDIKFVKVDSLSTHSIAITTKGEVMAWGNGDKYRLGHGTTTKEYAPRIIDALSVKGKVADVACGLGHTLALMGNGDIYAWGNGSNGRLGLGDTNDRSTPTKLTIAMEGPTSASTFRYVVCGASHSLAVTSDGRVFAWGKNNQGQCGHGHMNDQLTAIEIRHFRDELNERVASAAGGWEHTLFCSTSGRVYSCGCGYKDSRRAGIPPVLGHGDCEKRLKPTAIQTFVDANEEMVRVSCGWDHSLAVSAQGALYTWGSGTNGKLGTGDEENCEVPTLVKSLAGKVVKDAKAGCEHTVALADNHELWTFGQGDSGRLGLGDTMTRKVPTIVDFSTHSGLQPVAIAVGDKYNLILADNVSKSPGKSAPSSPVKMNDTNSSGGKSRRRQSQQTKLSQVVPLRDIEELLALKNLKNLDSQNNQENASSPRDQDELLQLIAVNLARISSRYGSSLSGQGGNTVDRLPYGIDTSPSTFERVLNVIRQCQDQVGHSPQSNRMLEIIVVCLRILTVNVSQWTPLVGACETTASSLVEQVHATVDELARTGITPSQQVLDDQDLHLRALIRDEAAQVLRVGFMIFYPTTTDRAQLLSDLCSCESHLSPRADTLASKLCEDSVAHHIILETFRRSPTHECFQSPGGDSEQVTDDHVNSVPRVMVALLHQCAHEAEQLCEGQGSEQNDAHAARIRVLTVFLGHWLGVAAARIPGSEVEGDKGEPIDEDSANSTICDCCMTGISSYLSEIVHEGAEILTKICEQSEAVLPHPEPRFLSPFVLQAVQAACAFLASKKTQKRSQASYSEPLMCLDWVNSLIPGVRSMMEVIDQLQQKLSSKKNHTETQIEADITWLEKLGFGCALLCGEISSCLFRLFGERNASGFGDALSLAAKLLEGIHSPSMKSALLTQLAHTVAQHTSSPTSAFPEDASFTMALASLCSQLTKSAASSDLPLRIRTTALAIWLWVLRHAPVASTRLVELVVESGIAMLAGGLLLAESTPSAEHDQPQRLFHQIASHRSHPSSRLRPIEDMVGSLRPSHALFTVAYEVFSTSGKLLCSTVHYPTELPHPLLCPIQTDFQSDPVPFRQPQPRLTSSQTIKAVFDCILVLLQIRLGSRKTRHKALSPFTHSSISSGDSQSPTSAFLLASPLSISSSRSHIVKPLRLPRVAPRCGTCVSIPLRAISLWAFFDAPLHPKDSISSPQSSSIVVLAAVGDTSDRLQESTVAAGTNVPVELGTKDNLRAVLFASSENGEWRLGYTITHDNDRVASQSDPEESSLWETWIVDEAISVGQWIHFTISLTDDVRATTYVDGRRTSCTSRSSPSKTKQEDIGILTTRAQLVTGGTFDEIFKEAIGLAARVNEECSPAAAIEVLIDDVWVFADSVDEAVVQELFHQGPTILQMKRSQDDDNKMLDLLRLLQQLFVLLPPSKASEQRANSVDAPNVGVLVRDVLFELLRTCRAESSFEIALIAAETASLVVPVVSAPSQGVLDALLSCIKENDPAAHDIRDEVSQLSAFSARAGVQSAAVAASQVSMSGLFRQMTNRAHPVDNDTDSMRQHTILTAHIINLVHTLSGLPGWQRHCVDLLNKVAATTTALTQAETSEPSLDETLAVLTMVAGYSENFANAQAVAHQSVAAVRPQTASFTSTQRSSLLLASDAYFRMTWQFGCDLHNAKLTLRARQELVASRETLQAHDKAVVDRVRLQSALLRSLVGQLHSSTASNGSEALRRRLLSDPEAIAALLNAANIRLRRLIKARLGPDRKHAMKLVSVQFVEEVLSQSRSTLVAIPRLVVEDDLEVCAASLYAKLQRQQSADGARDVFSIARQHYWREPKVALTPLETLSGEVEIRGLMVRAIQHFPTIRLGRATITANSGLWYYQVQLFTDGLMQIGFVDMDFVPDAVQGQGVGDHSNSWAFDGYRRKKWNVSSSDYGETWKARDVVGVLLDSDRMELSYFLNGKFLGVAFSNLPISPTSLLFPAISLNADQCVRFDFGETVRSDQLHDKVSAAPFSLPSLKSPLDAQRLRPVVVAIEDISTGIDEAGEEQTNAVGSDNDDGSVDGDSAGSGVATPVTPKSNESFKIYHSSDVDKEFAAQLPGSIDDDDSDLPLASVALMGSIQPNVGVLQREDSDIGDSDGTTDGTEGSRKAELVHGLVNLGFPQSWATRCAEETSFTLSDTGAISWILEKMEGEAVSSMSDTQQTPLEATGTDEVVDASSVAVSRRALDDLSLGPSGLIGAPGRQNWQLALSPSRDGRPHSEQFLRSRVPLSSPQKHREGIRSVQNPNDVNPFHCMTLTNDQDAADSLLPESETHAWNATASHGFYKSIPTDSLRHLFPRLDLTTYPDATRNKDETPRRPPAGVRNRHEEDLLPATLVTHSVLSLAYVRLAVEALLFGCPNDVSAVYAIAARWPASGLFEFVRVQLLMDPREIPVSCSRSACLSDETRIRACFVRMFQYEMASPSSDPTCSPLAQGFVNEIIARVADALRDLKRSEGNEKSLVCAMNARWTLWLISTLEMAVVNDAESGDSILRAQIRVPLQALFEPAFVGDITKLAATATRADMQCWQNAAFGIIHHVMMLDTLTRSQPTQTMMSLIHVPFFVELLASLLRKDQSRRVAFGEPISTLWEIVLAHFPPTQTQLVANYSTAKNEIGLRVEQVAPTYVAVAWECQEHGSEDAALISNSVLSLSVTAGPTRASIRNEMLLTLPPKGSLIVRPLAPDTQYTICMSKTSTPIDATEAFSEKREPPPVVEQAVHVRTPPEPIFALDGDAAGKNLVLSNRSRTVKNVVNKKWHTVRASVGFDEGVHHWHVRIDTCVSKNIFIGICTVDASLENYVGSDAYGYGFLANKAVWHNKSKIHAYGEIFKQGDVLQVTLDCNARTLSYSRNGEFLGIAASNLHVANGNSNSADAGGSASGSVGCKWFPAFSLYNKDDQLTLIVPQDSSSSGGVDRPVSQHASVCALVGSARRVIEYIDCIRNKTSDCGLSDLHKNAYAAWQQWKQGNVCWRESAVGELLEIDTRHDVVAQTFGLAPGDMIFTSRGQCVVLGVCNHELWYEIIDALELPSNRTASAFLGSWSLSACRDMLKSPDEFPVHRRRTQGRHAVLSEETKQAEALELDVESGRQENLDDVVSELTFEQMQLALAMVDPMDALLMAFVDAVVAHRGLSSPYQLSYADLSSAMVLHEVVDALSALTPSNAAVLDLHAVLMRLGFLFYLNQHVYRVVRLFLTQDASLHWEQSVFCAKNVRLGTESEPEKQLHDQRIAAARLAADVAIPRSSLLLRATRDSSKVISIERRGVVAFLQTHLFETQREQLTTEALRRSATPTVVGTASDAKATELADDNILEPKEMLRLKIRFPAEGTAEPFWTLESTERGWMMPTKDRRASTLFVQVSIQLRGVDPRECRRQYASPLDALPVFRSFHLSIVDSLTDPSSETTVPADSTSQYLKLWDDLFLELQSTRFPLFVPVDTTTTELDVNANLLLSEFAVCCGVCTDEALEWFFQLGQLLGIVWRAGTVVPLQYISLAFWRDLVQDPVEDPVNVGDRRTAARVLAVRTVREGLCSIVPYECLQLSTPQSIRARLSDTDILQLERLHRDAVYDHEALHHEAFWVTVRAFSSLERQALVRFLTGKTTTHHGDDPMEQWKREVVVAATGSSPLAPPPFRLEIADALADAQDHPDACFPVVHVVDAHCSRLHLPVYSSATVLRHKLVVAMSTLPSLV